MNQERLGQGGVFVPQDRNQRRDLALILRIRAGDPHAKDELVRKYLPMVKHIVKRHYASFLEFDDLMQEGFIGLLAAIDEYRPEDFNVKFSSFAYMCIIRKVYNAIKQSNGNKHKALNQAVSLHASVGADENRTVMDLLPADDVTSDPALLYEVKHCDRRVDTILQHHLSVLEYTVTALMLEGYTCGEIERVIGVKAKVIDNARTRVKLKLKRIVDTYGSLLNPQVPLNVRRRRDLYMKIEVNRAGSCV